MCSLLFFFIQLSHVYLLAVLLFVSLFWPYCTTKSLPESQIVLEIMRFSDTYFNDVLSDCFKSNNQNMAHVSQCTATKLNVSVCYYYLSCYFAENLTQNLPQLCFICYWKHPEKPLASTADCDTLRRHQWTHYILWCWTTRRMSFCVVTTSLFEAMAQVSSLSKALIALSHCLLCLSPRCEYVGVEQCRPYVIHVCRATTSRGTQHCTSFLLFNFWIFNACVNTGVLSHPMNVCKYAGVYIAASRKHRDYSDTIS